MKFITTFLSILLLVGCAATTTQQSAMTSLQLEEGMQRSDVIAKIGQPTTSSLKGDIRSDVYRQTTTNYAHGAACTAAGLATMGLGFIFCDGVSKKSVVLVKYRDDKLESVQTSRN